MLKIVSNMIVSDTTGEVFCSSINPKYSDWMYDDYKAEYERNKTIRFLQLMKAEEIEISDQLDSPNFLAEQKWDGHRASLSIVEGGCRIFSKNVSKKTGWFSENSDQLPHIRELQSPEFIGTIIDGEITLPIPNCTCRDVQSVTGSLPQRAIEFQVEKGLAILNAFDIIYYKGINVQNFPLWKRKILLYKVINESPFMNKYVRMCTMWLTEKALVKFSSSVLDYANLGRRKFDFQGFMNNTKRIESYNKLYRHIVSEGDEGLILKDMNSLYVQKRSNSFIKLKEHTTFDCVIMNYEEPTAIINLGERKTKEEDWLYWESYEKDISTNGLPKHWNRDECCPVTKLYAMGWIGAIHIGVYKTFDKDKLTRKDKKEIKKASLLGDFAVIEDEYSVSIIVQVGRCAGLDDETREEISKNREKYLGSVIEVEAQKIINMETGSLQHPRFKCFRIDKSPEDCTFNEHIRKYEETK